MELSTQKVIMFAKIQLLEGKKRKEMFERTVENLKKLDKESLAIVKASIEILAARQQMDENTPTNAA